MLLSVYSLKAPIPKASTKHFATYSCEVGGKRILLYALYDEGRVFLVPSLNSKKVLLACSYDLFVALTHQSIRFTKPKQNFVDRDGNPISINIFKEDN